MAVSLKTSKTLPERAEINLRLMADCFQETSQLALHDPMLICFLG